MTRRNLLFTVRTGNGPNRSQPWGAARAEEIRCLHPAPGPARTVVCWPPAPSPPPRPRSSSWPARRPRPPPCPLPRPAGRWSAATTSTAPPAPGINEANWLYDIGTSYPGGAPNWGTGEIEYDDRQHRQRQPGRRRPPRHHPAPGRLRPVDVGPDRDPAHRLPAAGRRQAADRGVAAAAERDRRRGRWATGRRSGRWVPRPARSARPTGRASARSTSWRTINGRSTDFGALHCGPGIPGTCNETTGLGSGERACPGCLTSFHTYGVEWDKSVTPETLRWYRDGAGLLHPQPEPGRPADLGHRAQPRLLHHPQRGHGRRLPGRVRRRPDRGHPARRADAGRLRRGLLRRRRHHRRPTPPHHAAAEHAPAGRRERVRHDPGGVVQRQAGGIQQEATTDAGGGQNIGWIANGDWAAIRTWTSAARRRRQFSARVASGAGGGVSGLVEVRLDSRTNAPIGSFAVANTGGWQSWRTVPGEHQRGDRRAHGLPDLHQRPAGRFRERQLVHLRATDAAWRRGGPGATASGPPRTNLSHRAGHCATLRHSDLE